MNKTEILNIVNEPSKIDYRRAFKIACDLLNGDVLYGVDTDKIYELMMQKDDVVSSSSYEEYILNHLQDLDQGQYACEPTTKNDLGVDCISRADARSLICEIDIKHHTFGISRKAFKDLYNGMDDLPPVTPQEPIFDKVRAEMLEEMLSHSGTGEEVIQAYADGLKKGLDILDKYKVKSEVNK